VILFGRIAEEEDPEEKKRLLRLLGMKYMPSAEIMEEDLRKNGPNACVLVLSIEHMSGKGVREK
jgi:nitroimidazol reductase NimA-like FMN-containing flavoprotein (pyridoxamine 5'-phosphate oxidase superfamily)